MNIKPQDVTIKALLKSGRQFVVPRFQREYSWEKRNCEEFINDIVKAILLDNGTLKTTPYFLGTMLFVGNFIEKGDLDIQIVDGQQRITTITILFSVISDIFREQNEERLSELIFDYIMTKDDNDQQIRIIRSETSYPFFSFYIQDRKKEDKTEPSSEEEICIQETYNYYKNRLEEKNIKKYFKSLKKDIDDIDYIEILKTIRDQILACFFISIATDDDKQAYRIFEILNAKGKKLAYIDLIKNRIFEQLQDTEPVDIAKVKWDELKDIINECDITSVGLGTYYRHYWASAYKQTNANRLYDEFLAKVASGTYKNFLSDLVKNAKYYVKIIKPKREDYKNKKDKFWLVQSLNVLSNYFSVSQVRVVLMPLFALLEEKKISTNTFKKVVMYLENFHFAYTAIMSGKANRLDTHYSKVAKKLRASHDSKETQKILQEYLYKPLNALFPNREQFVEQFVKMVYTKKSTPSNMKCKYAINKLHCFFQGIEVFDDTLSIEHIEPESNGEATLNIGNLIALEEKLNSEAGNESYINKLPFYKKSTYKWVDAFVEDNETWSIDKIEERAKNLAGIYYDNILTVN